MPTTWQDHLAAVCANPHDDKLRLAFAAWLQKNGQAERAELIRVQLKLEEIPDPNSKKALSLWSKALDLNTELSRGRAAKRATPWLAELPKLKGVTWNTMTSRGFFRDVTFDSVKAMKEHAAAVLAAAPVTEMSIKRMSPKATQELLAQDWLERLTNLRLFGPVGPEGMQALADSPHFSRLQVLWIMNGRIGDRGMIALARGKGFSSLEMLRVKGDCVGLEGIKTICSSKSLPNLKKINSLGMGLNVAVLLEPGLGQQFAERFPNSDWTI